MERYKVEKWGGPGDTEGYWCLIDTLQQRMVVGPESQTICERIADRLNGRPGPGADEYSEMDEVADAILAAT